MLVRAVTTVEPEWDDQQRETALALMQRDQLTCTGCGGWLPDTSTTSWEDYEVGSPHRCGKCTAIQKKAEGHKPKEQMEALRWGAEPKPRAISRLKG